MSSYREIVTKAIIGKCKKTTTANFEIECEQKPDTILGCWVINHNFKATLNQKKVDVNGCFEIDVWYSYDDNTKTDIARASKKYSDTIKVRELICDNVSEESDIIVRVLQQPTCTNACITDEGIEVEIVFELQVEVIGETKMMVTVLSCGNENVNTIDDFENEINEDFIRE